jgi:hypothetical protein
MRMAKIRVFKHYFPNEKLDYSFREDDHSASLDFKTIRDLAKFTREFVLGLEANKRASLIAIMIDFSPEHDIVCLAGFPPKRYFRLSEVEQQEFWEEFTKS